MPTTPFLDLSTIHTPTVGGTPPASWGTAVRNNLDTVARPPGVVATGVTNQTVSDATTTIMNLDGPDLRDTDGFHDPASNPSKITIPSGLDGYYDLNALCFLKESASASRIVYLRLNGSDTQLSNHANTGAAGYYATVTHSQIPLSAGDVLEIAFRHTAAGGSLVMRLFRLSLVMVAWP